MSEIDRTAETLDELPAAGVQVIALKNPVTVNGTTYTEIRLDFDSLTGADMEAIENILVAEGSITPQLKEFSKAYLMQVAARAARVNINDIRAFPINVVTQLTLRAQAFLMNAD